MAVHQLRTAALESRPDPQEEKMNLNRGRKKRSATSWAELPIRAPLGGRAGPERGLCVGVGRIVSANRKEKEKVESQKEVELGCTDERMEERKETG